eukprot:4567242-Pyramimonas_sp.AAC.1
MRTASSATSSRPQGWLQQMTLSSSNASWPTLQPIATDRSEGSKMQSDLLIWTLNAAAWASAQAMM